MHSVFDRFSGPWRWLALGLALAFAHLPAQADLWAYVDEQGITHFAATQVDGRYKLFFKGADFSRLDLMIDATTALKARNARVASAQAGLRASRRLDALEKSASYKNVRQHMLAAARTHRVDYELLKAVIAAESGFDPQAVSPKGAVGLMQLMPATAQRYGVKADPAGRKDRQGKPLPARTVEEKLTDPHTNINAGARYLADLLRLFKGELELAVAAYNAGEGAVQRAGNRIPNYKETQGYVDTVLGLYGAFKPRPVAAGPGRIGTVAASSGRAGPRLRVEIGGTSTGPEGGRAAPRKPGSAEAVAPIATMTPVVYPAPTE